MTFSEQELICFNSVLDKKRIFGTDFSAPENPDQEYIDQTIQELKKDGFLDEENKPNQEFVVAVKTLENYKNADNYLIMNHMKFALNKEKNYTVLLAKEVKGFQMTAVDKRAFLYQLMNKSAYLSQEDSGEEDRGSKILLTDWKNESTKQAIENLICVQKVIQNKFEKMRFLYNIGKHGFIYNPEEERLIRCGPLGQRKLLLELFDM